MLQVKRYKFKEFSCQPLKAYEVAKFLSLCAFKANDTFKIKKSLRTDFIFFYLIECDEEYLFIELCSPVNNQSHCCS